MLVLGSVFIFSYFLKIGKQETAGCCGDGECVSDYRLKTLAIKVHSVLPDPNVSPDPNSIDLTSVLGSFWCYLTNFH